MTEERILTLVLPRGQLIQPEKWNVTDVLEAAKICKCHRGKHIGYESFDPQIEPVVLRPRDIPRDISRRENYEKFPVYDAGITGRDLVLESGFKLQEVANFNCGCVDLHYITTPENMEKAEEARERALESYLSVPEGMDPLDSFFYFLSKDSRLKCRTEYPSLAERSLGDLVKRLDIASTPRFLVEPSRGQTEEHLIHGAADIILEAVATGDSYKGRGLVLLRKIIDSTAGLYMDEGCIRSFDSSSRAYFAWKKQKVMELGERIKGVSDDIRRHFQVVLSLSGPHSFYRPEHYESIFRQYRFRARPISTATKQVSGSKEISLVFNNTYLSQIIKFMKGLCENGIDASKAGVGQGVTAVDWAQCFRLKSLYAYCPVFKEDTIEVKTSCGKYPCADSSKLRNVHQTKAIVYSVKGR